MSSVKFKRSRKAALMFTVPAATLLLQGCGSDDTIDASVFSSVEECTEFFNPLEECQAAFAEAAALHPKVAPRYADQQACETDFGTGQCETAPEQRAQGSFFMPMMMGFLAGQMMGRSGMAPQSQQAAAAGRASAPNQPLYRSRDDQGAFRTANNARVATQPGPTQVKRSAVQPRPASLAQRGGFGAQAQRRAASSSRMSYGG